METKLSRFRQKYPEYDNRNDDELLQALYNKSYKDQLGFDDFLTKMRDPIAGTDEPTNPDTGQPWTPEEVDATKISPSTPAGVRLAAEQAREENIDPAEYGLQEGDVSKTFTAGAARTLVGNRLNEMEAGRREWAQSVIDERIGIEGEEHRERITQETTDHVNKWGTGSFYDAFIRPHFSQDGKNPGERINEWADAKLKTRSQVAQKKGAKPFLNSNAEWYTPTGRDGWFAGDSVFSDPEAFLLTIAENAPQIGVSIGAGMIGGKGGAIMRLKGLSSKARTNPALVREAATKGASAGGMVAGTATEAVLIRDATANETRDRIMQLPEEEWQKHGEYQNLRDEVGEARAKQMITDERARVAGTVAMLFSAPLGAPAGALFGRRGAGVGTKAASGILGKIGQITGSMAKSGLTEAATEGPQEVIENMVSNAAISTVDPKQAWTEGNLNAFLGGAAIGGTMGIGGGGLGALAPETGATKDSRQLMADKKTRTFLTAAKDREKLQAKMSDPDAIIKMSTEERLKNWEDLEKLEETESKLMLKAEPGLRRNIMERGLDNRELSRALTLLDTLQAKSKTTLKQIDFMREARTTEDNIAQQAEDRANEREQIRQRVEKDTGALQEFDDTVRAIEEVQQGGALTEPEYAFLAEKGYGRWTDKDHTEFLITKKGQAALTELKARADQINSNLERGYVGPERRKDFARRDAVKQMSPEELEDNIYRDVNTKLANKRAYTQDEQTEPSEATAVIDVTSFSGRSDAPSLPKRVTAPTTSVAMSS